MRTAPPITSLDAAIVNYHIVVGDRFEKEGAAKLEGQQNDGDPVTSIH